LKPLEWLGKTKEQLSAFPRDVCRDIGYALHFAQSGDKHPAAKPLKGFIGAGVLEVVENYDGNTYRVVYTVRFANVVYVLHVFQKKSKRGIATPRQDLELIQGRLKDAREHYRRKYQTRIGRIGGNR
jgi:phage-related protein